VYNTIESLLCKTAKENYKKVEKKIATNPICFVKIIS